MHRPFNGPLVLTLLLFTGFLLLTMWRSDQPLAPRPNLHHDRVVVTAPLLVTLFGGDRFLAANLETIRLSATGIEQGMVDQFYLIRAHKVVADLNPCHEQNYYIANALLTWGGAVEEGGDILERATLCRRWDEMPPFFYGFNQYFFNHNIPQAQRWLHIAAKRSTENADAFRTLAIAIEVEQIDDVKMAIELLEHERDKADSENLYNKLNMRVIRLQSLQQLREAQHHYQEKTGKPLLDPIDLITTGLLEKFPHDPMRLGYEFVDGEFQLKRARMAGMGR